MQSILIVEDIKDTSLWLERIIENVFTDTQITACTTCIETRLFIKQHTISLALVDINLPDGNGLDLITEIRQSSPHAYIITMTIFDDDEHILTALRNGANGYLLKDLSETVFIQKLRGIITGDPPLSPSIARRILHCFAQNNIQNSHNKEESAYRSDCSTLSQREREVLTLVAKGLSRKEIAELLTISSNTGRSICA